MITLVRSPYLGAIVEENGYKVELCGKDGTTPLRPYLSEDEAMVDALLWEELLSKREPYKEVAVTPISEEPLDGVWLHPYDFFQLFTLIEQAQIVTKAKDEPLLETFRLKLLMANRVYLTDRVTLEALDFLISLGILSEERKLTILNGGK